MSTNILLGEGVALRNLDFAAHRSLLSRDYFENQIKPRKIATLVQRFMSVLKFLIAKPQSDETRSTLVCQTLRQEEMRLKEIFHLAYQIKVKAILSKNSFQAVLYPPRMTFDGAVMEMDLRDPQLTHGGSQKNLSVLLSLLPSLVTYSCDRRQVDYNGFVLSNEAPGETPHLINKAVVGVRETWK